MADPGSREALELDLARRQEDLATHVRELEHAVRQRLRPKRQARRVAHAHPGWVVALAAAVVLFGAGLLRRHRRHAREREILRRLRS